ncbi:protein of unknown function [Methylocaldum szegediense]|uniref:Uncharacterized protein n=1 Tax=Methylocaldum szegediense TaxID=73780 RepID=A0ABN8WZR0_9GAMM|nr:protein of unknown function [Methylocaldum szegediense]
MPSNVQICLKNNPNHPEFGRNHGILPLRISRIASSRRFSIKSGINRSRSNNRLRRSAA